MSLITDEYRDLNLQLHIANENYGVSGKIYAEIVRALSAALNTKDILDYGCGKRTLEKALGFSINNYDPCIAGVDSEPAPADLVVCTDVLEHIEPDCLDNVLNDLRRVTKFWGLFSIATRPAKKFLADGRNAHLIQENKSWWIGKIRSKLDIVDSFPINDDNHDLGFIVIVKHKDIEKDSAVITRIAP